MNEVSGRYSIMKDEFYVPEDADIAPQSSDNKQGRSSVPYDTQAAEEIRKTFKEEQESSYKSYTSLVDRGLARELARINLPLSLYTEFYWQMDLHNLFHFLKLRLDSHAQKEIRKYAEIILGITRKVAPLATASFENYQKEGVLFSGEEMAALRAVLDGQDNPLPDKKRERFNEKIASGIQL
jgi:thymidylate synthase (FAD)